MKRRCICWHGDNGVGKQASSGLHGRFQTRCLILRLATMHSSQLQRCVFTLLRFNHASPVLCPVLGDAGVECDKHLWLLGSIISLLFRRALVQAIKC